MVSLAAVSLAFNLINVSAAWFLRTIVLLSSHWTIIPPSLAIKEMASSWVPFDSCLVSPSSSIVIVKSFPTLPDFIVKISFSNSLPIIVFWFPLICKSPSIVVSECIPFPIVTSTPWTKSSFSKVITKSRLASVILAAAIVRVLPTAYPLPPSVTVIPVTIPADITRSISAAVKLTLVTVASVIFIVILVSNLSTCFEIVPEEVPCNINPSFKEVVVASLVATCKDNLPVSARWLASEISPSILANSVGFFASSSPTNKIFPRSSPSSPTLANPALFLTNFIVPLLSEPVLVFSKVNNGLPSSEFDIRKSPLTSKCWKCSSLKQPGSAII